MTFYTVTFFILLQSYKIKIIYIYYTRTMKRLNSLSNCSNYLVDVMLRLLINTSEGVYWSSARRGRWGGHRVGGRPWPYMRWWPHLGVVVGPEGYEPVEAGVARGVGGRLSREEPVARPVLYRRAGVSTRGWQPHAPDRGTRKDKALPSVRGYLVLYRRAGVSKRGWQPCPWQGDKEGQGLT